MIRNLTIKDIQVPSPVILTEKNILEFLSKAAKVLPFYLKGKYTGEKRTYLFMTMADLLKYRKKLNDDLPDQRAKEYDLKNPAHTFLGYQIHILDDLRENEFYFSRHNFKGRKVFFTCYPDMIIYSYLN